jgi:hypothetical protein
MPVGFPAYTEDSLRYKGSSRKELAGAVKDTLDELGWQFRHDGRWRIIASVPAGFYLIFLCWGAQFIIDIEDGHLHLRSQGSVPIEWLDVGQHSANIKRFLDRFEEILDEAD